MLNIRKIASEGALSFLTSTFRRREPIQRVVTPVGAGYWAKLKTKYGWKLVPVDQSGPAEYRVNLVPQEGMRSPHKRTGRRKAKAQLQLLKEPNA